MKYFTFCPAFIAFTILLCNLDAAAQKKKMEPDPSYIKTYPKTWMGRVYVSKKYSPFTIPASTSMDDLMYIANNKVNVGIGATYNNYTLNVSYGIDFLNNDYNKDGKGKTKGLDFQFHLFPNGLTADVLAILHEGAYLKPRGTAASSATNYYYRADVKIHEIGFAVYRVANSSKFSHRAAFVQNELQRKSAGTLLYGGQINLISVEGDSALVPKQIQSAWPQAGITKINALNIGPGVGYAYTLVMDEHLFITGSLIANADLSFNNETVGSTKNKKFGIKPAAIYKAAVGYNSDTWSFVANLAGNASFTRGKSSEEDYFLPTGMYRFTIAKRFMPKKK